jgi:hypothetical protein
MFLMYNKYKDKIDLIYQHNDAYEKCSFSEDEFQKFVRIRNDITHIGDTIWSENIGIVYSVVEVMIYLACFERVGVNIDLATRLLSNVFH